jgi:hypothetical protein
MYVMCINIYIYIYRYAWHGLNLNFLFSRRDVLFTDIKLSFGDYRRKNYNLSVNLLYENKILDL